MVIFSYLFFVYNNRSNKIYSFYTLLVQNILILGFLIFLVSNSNPFLKIIPVPLEGLGLNPILQDPALAIHPPLLYLGFVGSSIYFSAAIAAILSNFDGKICFNNKNLGINFMDFSIIRNNSWFYLGLLRIRLGRFLVLGSC